jgi:hypothetical protein
VDGNSPLEKGIKNSGRVFHSETFWLPYNSSVKKERDVMSAASVLAKSWLMNRIHEEFPVQLVKATNQRTPWCH